MDTKVWIKADDKRSVLLALTDDAIYRYVFAGKKAKQEATEAADALVAGRDPKNFVGRGTTIVPLSTIRRVEVSHNRETVKFVTVEDDKTIKVEFTVKSGDDGPGVARQVVERAGFSHAETSEDISVFEAVLGPVILGVIVAIFWGLTYSAATSLDAGKDFNVNGGSSKSRGFKRMIRFFAEILGTKGTLAVGGVFLVVFVTWAVLMVVKRPQRMVWGPPIV